MQHGPIRDAWKRASRNACARQTKRKAVIAPQFPASVGRCVMPARTSSFGVLIVPASVDRS